MAQLTIEQAMQIAVEHHQAGRFGQAEQLYRRVLQLDPRNADVLNLLGMLAHSSGEYDLALEWIGKAIAVAPLQGIFHYSQGEVFRTVGRRAEAEACYAQALRLQPHDARAHNALGVVLLERGAVAEAETCFREAVRLSPNGASYLNNLGTALLIRGSLDEARRLLERAIEHDPGNFQAYNGLGSVYQKMGKMDEAQTAFTRSIELQPGFACAHRNLGTVYHQRGLLAEAEASLRQAIRLQADYADAHLALASVLKAANRLPEAQNVLEQSLALYGDPVEALTMLSFILERQSKPAEARAVLEQALAIRSSASLQIRHALVLPVIYESMEAMRAARIRLESALERLRCDNLAVEETEPISCDSLFYLAFQGLNDRGVHESLVALLHNAAPWLSFVAPHCLTSAPACPTDSHRPIRVGFISLFFVNHTIGTMNAGLIRNLSRTHFRVILLRLPHLGADDEMAAQIEQGADVVVKLPYHLAEARRMIAEQELDILFYTDIGMDTLTYFLAFARLAPVQCVTWGHPVTTGLPTIDYFVSSSKLETSESDEDYTETLVRLDHLNSFYDEPRLPGSTLPRGAFGLPDDANLYVCTQNLFKFHPEFDAILGQILRGDPQGRIVLFEGLQQNWTSLLSDRFRRTFPDEAGRVVFLPRLSPDEFLRMQVGADALLDTIHFGGGNTSLLALASGTPIVTLPGSHLRSRITYACYRQMDVLDCVAADPYDYVRIALRLGTDRPWRESIRSKILMRKYLIYENLAAVRELEQFFLEAVNGARSR